MMKQKLSIKILIGLGLLYLPFLTLAQEEVSESSGEATSFTLEDLNQQGIQVKQRLQVKGFEEQGDTSIITYGSSMVEKIQVYSVYIEGSHPILNPNPTGLIINDVELNFYCSPERSKVKYLSAFMDIYEFTYLDKNYICFFAFREDCISKCRYRCYNLFDVTNPNEVVPYSFASIFAGKESFGDFNSDGTMDFVMLAPKSPESYIVSDKDDNPKSNVLITAYEMKDGYAEELFRDNGTPYYLYVKPIDEEIKAFTVLQNDWFIPLKDSEGKTMETTPYYPAYVPFDPMNDFIYDMKGHRVDKKTWVVHLNRFPDMEGAQDFCQELIDDGFREAYILVEQYNDITFHVLYGNYWGKEPAQKALTEIKDRFAVEGAIKNVRKDF